MLEAEPALLAISVKGVVPVLAVEVLVNGDVLGIVTVPPAPATKLPKLSVVAFVMVSGCTTVAVAGMLPVAVGTCACVKNGMNPARLTARLKKWDLKMTELSD
jgi:hypothetical protein